MSICDSSWERTRSGMMGAQQHNGWSRADEAVVRVSQRVEGCTVVASKERNDSDLLFAEASLGSRKQGSARDARSDSI